jgi:hypothetical protein
VQNATVRRITGRRRHDEPEAHAATPGQMAVAGRRIHDQLPATQAIATSAVTATVVASRPRPSRVRLRGCSTRGTPQRTTPPGHWPCRARRRSEPTARSRPARSRMPRFPARGHAGRYPPARTSVGATAPRKPDDQAGEDHRDTPLQRLLGVPAPAGFLRGAGEPPDEEKPDRSGLDPYANGSRRGTTTGRAARRCDSSPARPTARADTRHRSGLGRFSAAAIDRRFALPRQHLPTWIAWRGRTR